MGVLFVINRLIDWQCFMKCLENILHDSVHRQKDKLSNRGSYITTLAELIIITVTAMLLWHLKVMTSKTLIHVVLWTGGLCQSVGGRRGWSAASRMSKSWSRELPINRQLWDVVGWSQQPISPPCPVQTAACQATGRFDAIAATWLIIIIISWYSLWLALLYLRQWCWRYIPKWKLCFLWHQIRWVNEWLSSWLCEYVNFFHGLAQQWRPWKKWNLAQG